MLGAVPDGELQTIVPDVQSCNLWCTLVQFISMLPSSDGCVAQQRSMTCSTPYLCSVQDKLWFVHLHCTARGVAAIT